MAELTYTRVGDYYIPNLILDEGPEQNVFYGKYGSLRRDYLQEYRPFLWAAMASSGKLTDHLKEVERTAQQRMDTLLPQLMKAAGVTEELKARDPMQWVGMVNTLKAQVDESILVELIYV